MKAAGNKLAMLQFYCYSSLDTDSAMNAFRMINIHQPRNRCMLTTDSDPRCVRILVNLKSASVPQNAKTETL